MNYYSIDYWKDGEHFLRLADLAHPVSVLNEIHMAGESMPRLVERVVVTIDWQQAIEHTMTTLYLDEEMTGYE